MSPLTPAATLGTFWGALAYLAGATLPHAIALGVMSTVAVVGLLGLARAGATRKRAAQAQPRKRMIAVGKIRPKRPPETWSVSYGTEALRISRYTTTVNDSGPMGVREKEAA